MVTLAGEYKSLHHPTKSTLKKLLEVLLEKLAMSNKGRWETLKIYNELHGRKV